MSPEQVRGEPLDGRSDIFGLGCLLYSAIAGRSPFEAKSRGETYSTILTAEPTPLGRIAPTTSHELLRIVRKYLEKDRTQRYQTVRDVATVLQNLRDSSASDAVRTAVAADRSSRLFASRRSRRLAAAAAIVIAGATLLAVAARWTLLARRAVADVRSVAILPFKPLTATSETVARVYALQGDAGETARWLKETVDWGFPAYPIFPADTFLDPVREAPPVKKLLADLQATWQSYRDALR